MRTYFTERGDLTDEEAASLAVRQVQAIEDMDAKQQATRRSSDDERRKADLELGEIIALAPHPDVVIGRVAANSTFTAGSLKERMEVYQRSVESGVMEELLSMALSYTGHRTIVGFRTKQRFGTPVADMSQRIAAARRSIERNGYFKGDDEFFRDSNLLPPPNTFERVLDRMEQDPEFRETKLGSTGTQRLLNIIEKHETRDHRGYAHDIIRDRAKQPTLLDRVANVTIELKAVVEILWARDDVPPFVLQETEAWFEQVKVIRDLAAIRRQEQPM